MSLIKKIDSYFNHAGYTTIDGLSYSADSLFISAKSNSNILIAANNNDDVRRIYDELRAFGKLIKKNDEIILIPGTEDMPYDMVNSDKYLSSSRNLGLIKYIESKKQNLKVITTIKNLQRKIVSPNILNMKTIRLNENQEIDLEHLKSHLIEIGYIASPQVNFCGEFAVRGSILDIFPGGSKLPVRIDLFDTEIESMRYFETDTQMTFNNSNLKSLYIVPINNIILEDKNVINFRKNFRSSFEGNPNDNDVYRNISNNIMTQGFNNYFPLLYDSTSTLFDYFLDIDNFLFFDDYKRNFENYDIDIKNRYDSYSTNNNMLRPSNLYLNKDEVIKNISTKNIIKMYKNRDFDKKSYNFYISAVPDISLKPYLEEPLNDLSKLVKKSSSVILFCEDDQKLLRLKDILKYQKINFQVIKDLDYITEYSSTLFIVKNYIKESFKINDLDILFVRYNDIFKEKIKQESKNNAKSTFFIDQLKNLDIGSPVVHEIHGVGRYQGLTHLDSGGFLSEYLAISYAENDKLYVPVSSLHLVNKYITTDEENAPLHKLGSLNWSNAKKKATKKAYDIAAELLELNAKRAMKKTLGYEINEFEYEKFKSEFIYDETEDQSKAIEDVIGDLCSEKLMDRLVCGDVGFGKTEIALRAAFICASNYKQVVVLAPTTLLAEQHEKVFKERFRNWPFNIKCLSRFKSKKEQDNIISEIKNGQCNIIVGTHKVIQKDIKFKSLGLLIIDEEQKFGVKHKEFLKKIKNEINVLTLTATPIPRTLNMSLGGIRDLSIIATSPENRMPIKTYVSNWEKNVIKDACDREINRGGQVFFLHNRVNDITAVYNTLKDLMPSYSIKVAHAQMNASQLEKIILEFYNKKFNILLSTTIIENGIDIANANTILVNRSDKFGLSQLHQIRGRVGRSNKQAFCYLLVSDRNLITENAKKRLLALETMEDLGSGFSIASRDLEIRGAGALLGDSQSGDIQEIGFSLYNRILTKAIKSLKKGEIPNVDKPLESVTEIDLNEIALIPENYINDINQRLVMYKKIANSTSKGHLDDIILELTNRFGLVPEELHNLIDITKMKLKYSKIGIRKINIARGSLKIIIEDGDYFNNEKLISFIKKNNNASFNKNNTLTFKKDFSDIREKKIVIANVIESIR